MDLILVNIFVGS